MGQEASPDQSDSNGVARVYSQGGVVVVLYRGPFTSALGRATTSWLDFAASYDLRGGPGHITEFGPP